MNKLIITLLTFFSFSALSQSNFGLIDHDRKYLISHNFLATDSLIYYTEESHYGIQFCSIDTIGQIDRTIVSQYYTAWFTKFINRKNNAFDVLYYHLFDIDINGRGVIHVSYDNGSTAIHHRIMDSYMQEDVHLSSTGDSLYVLDSRGFDIMEYDGVMILDSIDNIIGQIPLTKDHEYHSFMSLKDEVLLIADRTISRITDDFELDTIIHNEAQSFSALNHTDKLILLIGSELYEVDPITKAQRFMFNHDLDGFLSLGSYADELYFNTTDQNNYYYINTSDDGTTKDTVFVTETRPLDFQIVNDDLYYADRMGFHEFAANPIWHILRSNNDYPPPCRDVIIDYATVENTDNEVIQIDTFNNQAYETILRTYAYDISIRNVGNQKIDSLHIYSEDYYRAFDELEMPHFKKTLYDVEIGEIRNLQGDFRFAYFDEKLESLTFHIPGADHHLDCTPENNVFLVAEITSSTIDQEIKSPSVTLFPNPVSETLNIRTDKPYDSFKIYELSGKTLITGNTNTSIDVSTLQSGIYFIGIGGQTMKFIKN